MTDKFWFEKGYKKCLDDLDKAIREKKELKHMESSVLHAYIVHLRKEHESNSTRPEIFRIPKR